ncbi:OST-HTH Associated domain protein [Theileria parva strain Muguga]|uniref:OST-HTH Associated domain protein n=1 Tax=Theileria parva strain Muguga TaxID=333668 RepID=UPI001C6240A4|nr:OST-HTH Associated domain protein [Theileria parva strain Muguga]KAF5153582.1 OST-HTH Associated domain protein [Theileria parva strain Muguga]
MKENNLVKESGLESNMIKNKLDQTEDYQHESGSSCSSDGGSFSSFSTAYTSNLNNSTRLRDISGNGYQKNKSSKNKKPGKSFTKLDSIYKAINELYEEEIVPTVHEIRRKLNKNEGSCINGQKLLKLCSNDQKFQIIRLQGPGPNSRDIPNEWAILIRSRPFKHFNKVVDQDLVKVASDYLTFISTYQYYMLSEQSENKQLHDMNFECRIIDAYTKLFELDISIVPVEDIFNVGGRYVFAEHLKKNGPKEFRNLSLGTIVKVVQKLNEMGLLVYRGNCLVPVVTSKSAANKFNNNATNRLDQEQLSKIRTEVLSLFNIESIIPLSSLPLVYKRVHGVDLKYRDLGYEKLSDFIKNEVPTCRITTHSNQFVATICSDDEDGVSVNNSPDETPDVTKCSFNQSYTSQNCLCTSFTTVLYPLKITRI